MRWGAWIAVLVAVSVLQTTVVRFLPWPVVDLLLALALVAGLVLPVPEARLAGWLAGLCVDLWTEGPLGLHALMFGLALLALTRVREWVNLNVWWARWFIGLVVAVPAELAVMLCARMRLGGGAPLLGVLGHALLIGAVASLLAAAVVGLPALVGQRRRSHATAWW